MIWTKDKPKELGDYWRWAPGWREPMYTQVIGEPRLLRGLYIWGEERDEYICDINDGSYWMPVEAPPIPTEPAAVTCDHGFMIGSTCAECDAESAPSPLFPTTHHKGTIAKSTTEPTAGVEVRENLAKLCHAQWSGWMKYLFSKSEILENGDKGDMAVIPEWAVQRWKRQMETSYENLTDAEKDSDRKEADRILKIISGGAQADLPEAGHA